MQPVINRIEIILSDINDPVRHGFPWQGKSQLVHQKFLTIVRHCHADLFHCNICDHGWGSRAVWNQCCRYFGFSKCPVTIFSAFRALPFFLVIMNPFHLRRCDPEFFPYKSFGHILHQGITVGTVLIFFRQRDDLFADRKVSILVFTCGLGFTCCPFMAFYSCCHCFFRFFIFGFFILFCFLAARTEELPLEFIERFPETGNRFFQIFDCFLQISDRFVFFI